jgi:cytoskeletal protein RodZ
MNKFDFGQFIRDSRESRKLDIEFCSASLKIHRKFLEAIETNDYTIFDNYYQAQGFVQNYLEFLDVSLKDYIPRWRKEFYDVFEKDHQVIRAYYKPKKKRTYNVTFTLDKLIYLIGGVVTIGVLIWIGLSIRSLQALPLLEITSPENNHVTTEDLIDVFGKVDSDSELRINNEKIVIQTDGSFSTSLKLVEGFNTFKFTSKNPYGVTNDKILQVIYRPKKIEVYNPPTEADYINLSKQSTDPVKVQTTNPNEVISTKPATVVKTDPNKVLRN